MQKNRTPSQIFISYSRVDDKTASENDGWVAVFEKHLKVALMQRIGRGGIAELWRDLSLRGNQDFEKAIQEKIDSSVFFIALMSRGYLRSTFCQKELRMFHRKAEKDPEGLLVGDQLRIFTVLIQDIPYAEWPSECGTTSGFPFYEEERTFNPSQPGTPRFESQLEKLTEALYTVLDEMGCIPQIDLPELDYGSEYEEPLAKQIDHGRIYIAETSDALTDLRDRLVVDLENLYGIEIVPSPLEYEVIRKQLYPFDDPEYYNSWLSNQLQDVELAVHLLDAQETSSIDENTLQNRFQKQIDLLRELSLPQIIWAPKSFDLQEIQDPVYRAFVHRLKFEKKTEDVYDFIVGDRNDSTGIKKLILEKLGKLRRVPAPLDATCSSLLVTHAKDTGYLIKIADIMYERRNILPLINQVLRQADSDKRHEIEVFEHRIRQVNYMIIFYGEVSEEWVKARLIEAVKTNTFHNKFDLTLIVYGTPPLKPLSSIKSGLGSIDIRIIDNTEEFVPESILDFLDCV